MLLHIIRHGETDYNKNGVIQGSGVDTSLNQAGRKQAEAYYKAYKNENYERIYASELRRSRQTVDLWQETNIPIHTTDKINEINWGIHEGKSVDEEMRSSYKSLIDAWCSGNLNSRLEKGESAQELFDRLSKFLQHLRKQELKKVLVCSHGRTMRAMMTLLLNLPPKKMQDFNHSNTGLYAVKMNVDSPELILHNDTSHLNNYL